MRDVAVSISATTVVALGISFVGVRLYCLGIIASSAYQRPAVRHGRLVPLTEYVVRLVKPSSTSALTDHMDVMSRNAWVTVAAPLFRMRPIRRREVESNSMKSP